MRYFNIAAAIITAVVMAGCEGQEPEATPAPDGPESGVTAGIQLIADKNEVEADGVDCVTFRVVMTNDAGQEEELTELYPRAVRIVDVDTDESLPYKTFSTTSVSNKQVKYKAVYKEEESENTVVVKFQNREKYEKYYQKVAVADFTGTWCTGCPAMVDAIENMDAEIREHSVIMAIHTNSAYADDHLVPVIDKNFGKRVLQAFDVSSVPYCIFDLNEVSNISTKANISGIVRSYLSGHYATCGVRIISSSLEDMSLNVKVAMTSATGGQYDLGWAFVADGFVYNGGTLESGIYNDVLLAASDNFYKLSSERFTVEADEEVVKEFTCELPYLPDGFDPSKARVVAFALSPTENEYNSCIVDNITECPLGGGNDYILN